MAICDPDGPWNYGTSLSLDRDNDPLLDAPQTSNPLSHDHGDEGVAA